MCNSMIDNIEKKSVRRLSLFDSLTDNNHEKVVENEEIKVFGATIF